MAENTGKNFFAGRGDASRTPAEPTLRKYGGEGIRRAERDVIISLDAPKPAAAKPARKWASGVRDSGWQALREVIISERHPRDLKPALDGAREPNASYQVRERTYPLLRSPTLRLLLLHSSSRA